MTTFVLVYAFIAYLAVSRPPAVSWRKLQVLLRGAAIRGATNRFEREKTPRLALGSTGLVPTRPGAPRSCYRGHRD